jgi:hypothetical protein
MLKGSAEDHPADVEQFVEYLTVPENTHQSKGGVELMFQSLLVKRSPELLT